MNQTRYHNIQQQYMILLGTRLVAQGYVHMQDKDPNTYL